MMHINGFLQRTIGRVVISVARLKPSSRASSPRVSIESSSLYSFPAARNFPKPGSPFDAEKFPPVIGPPPSYGKLLLRSFGDCMIILICDRFDASSF